jgi:hypothetical protein
MMSLDIGETGFLLFSAFDCVVLATVSFLAAVLVATAVFSSTRILVLDSGVDLLAGFSATVAGLG